MTEERCVVDVLGIPYSVNITPDADDPKLESMDGYTDPSIKRIVISDVHRRLLMRPEPWTPKKGSL